MDYQKLDRIDSELIRLLSENGRLTNAELGRIVNLTRAAVRERVSRLMEEGVIDRFTIVVNPLKAGKGVSMYYEIDTEWTELASVAAVLGEREEITNIYQMSGRPHLHVHALLDDMDHADRFMRTLLTLKGITHVTSEFLITRYKERGALLI